jgi:trimeric autotransporter adhesin
MQTTHPVVTVGIASALALAMLGSSLRAQCSTAWQPGLGLPGVNGYIQATTMWDPDGPGPLPPRLVVGGQFTSAGTTITNNVAAYDPQSGTWSQFGTGATTPTAPTWASVVAALVAMPNGELVAAGKFTTAGGIATGSIARWNGTNWAPLGTGIGNGSVQALAVLPNGDLIAGDDFTLAGGVAVNNVARWNGSVWAPLGAGISPSLGNGGVVALTVLMNGDMVAGGLFQTAGGLPAPGLARWNGSTWSAMCSTITPAQLYPTVRDVVQLPNGDVIAAGEFVAIDGVPTNRIARWNGSVWSPLGAGADGAILDLETLPNGELVAGGYFATAGTAAVSHIAKWNGSNWSALGSGADDTVMALQGTPSGDLFAGGEFGSIGGAIANLAKWDGASWSAPAIGSGGVGGANDVVSQGTALPNGDLVVVGRFTTIGGIAANHIARWNGSTWSTLGNWLGNHVAAVTHLPNGDVLVGGSFSVANGAPANQVARWDGTGWSPLGNGPGGQVNGLVVLPNGHLVATGYGFAGPGYGNNFVTRWDGANWLPMAAEAGTAAAAVAVAANGDLLVGGSFNSLNGNALIRKIARWNGSTWSPLGSPANGVAAIAVLPNGDIVAASGAGSVGTVARWTGTSWSTLGTLLGQAWCLHALPDGDLLAGGEFTSVDGLPALRLARFDGTSWSTQGSGFTAHVFDLLSLRNGDVIATGSFDHAGGVASAKVARLASNCPATVLSQGVGCTGSGGPNVLTADSLPWTGSTFRATATGMHASALVLSVYGFTPISLPMVSVLPMALPGCEARMLPDLAELVLPTGGAALTALVLPDSPALAGIVLHHYVVPFEVDAALQIVAVTSSNSLQLTLGSF